VLQTEIADRERHLTDLSEHVERQAAAVKIYRQGANGLDLGDLPEHLATPSDSVSSGPARDASYRLGKSSPRWRSARTG
jgi:hypothetical protein